MFHGPREQVLPFFAGLGFQLPGRKGIADFLQEVTSKKDQRVSLRPPALRALLPLVCASICAYGIYNPNPTDVQQYWADDTQAYKFVPVEHFARAFADSQCGRAALAASEGKVPMSHAPHSRMDPLVRKK